ncbi:MAG: putative Ig domain-containing protein [Candidatus Margulisiibacteriota bacterium]
MKKLIIFTLFGFWILSFGFITPSHAGLTSGNYEIPSLIISGGGEDEMTSGNYKMQDIKGQGVIGECASGNYILQLGGIYTTGVGEEIGGPLEIVTESLPDGEFNKAYSETLEAKGGKKPYTWSIDGKLPEGLILDKNTGGISGTPTKVESPPSFNVKVIDSSDVEQSATQVLQISILPPKGNGPILDVTAAYLEGLKELGNATVITVEARVGKSAEEAASTSASGVCTFIISKDSKGSNLGYWDKPVVSGKSYYLALKHPNHLAVMKNKAEVLTDKQTTTLDFSVNTDLYKLVNGKDEPLREKAGEWYIRGGDINQDGRVDVQDYVELSKNWEKENTPLSDINGNNKTEIVDYTILSRNWEIKGYVK